MIRKHFCRDKNEIDYLSQKKKMTVALYTFDFFPFRGNVKLLYIYVHQ